MSLNLAQQARTREELAANHRLSGLTPQELQSALGFTAQQLDDTLAIRPASHPADVWLLRDYLEQEIRAQGKDPVPFSVLTESSRADAERWFSLRPVPPAVHQ